MLKQKATSHLTASNPNMFQPTTAANTAAAAQKGSEDRLKRKGAKGGHWLDGDQGMLFWF